MKFLNKLGLLALLVFAMSACVDQDPTIHTFPNPDVDFTYNVAPTGDTTLYPLDYYVVSTIQFNNISAKEGDITWDFGDGETSTVANPTHKYKKAGKYNVSLTIGEWGTRTYPILIYDIVPIISVASQSDSILEINNVSVDFGLRLPNPENKIVEYTWTFPEGAKQNGNPIPGNKITETSNPDGTVDVPAGVTFSHIGSQTVYVDAVFDKGGAEERSLDQASFNVQVASPIEAPTLYYAQVGGNIKALKLVDESLLPSGTKIYPYDMGVNAGENPFNLLYSQATVTTTDEETGETTSTTDQWIYILDAGKQYYYVNDEAGVLGDGRIVAMRVDGTNVNNVISNVGGPAFSDPFQGHMGSDGYIYYNDRNQGFSKVLETERGLVQENGLVGSTLMRSSYVAKNDLIPYYNRPLAYGAISAGLYKDSKGVWWWGKNYSGNVILRFRDSDIYTDATKATAATPPFPLVISGAKFSTFAIDEDRNKLYVWGISTATPKNGLNVYDLPGDKAELSTDATTDYVAMETKPVNTTADEGVYVKQMAIDKATGKVYFGFRPIANDVSGIGTGIVAYDPETGKCERYSESRDEALGIVINPTLSKLF